MVFGGKFRIRRLVISKYFNLTLSFFSDILIDLNYVYHIYIYPKIQEKEREKEIEKVYDLSFKEIYFI